MSVRPSELTKADFLTCFADVFEHSPWIAQQVWESGLDSSHDSVHGLHRRFSDVIHQASHEQKLELLLAHPQLAVGVAGPTPLTAASCAEQKGAGLDQCSAPEFAEFQHLNQAYMAKFGFPFIMAVKGADRRAILQAFKSRLAHASDQEFQTAIEQVIRIGFLRIESKLPATGES